MNVIQSSSVSLSEVTVSGATGCRMRELITDREGAPNFAMRQFEIAPGGNTPQHSHPWEHEVFILSGAGFVHSEAGPRPFSAGDAVFIAPDEPHSFLNTGEEPLRFLCLIPLDKPCCR